MKKVIFYINLMAICSLLLAGSKSKRPWELEEVSVTMISQEIKSSMAENERQKQLNQVQNTNTGIETANNKQWNKYKETSQKIQDRLRVVDFALQAIPTGYVMVQKSKEIKDYQSKIFREIRTAPQSLKDVLPKQLTFVKDLEMVTSFIGGLVLSYGVINQMERAERKILLDFALEEVERLSTESFSTLMVIRYAKEKAQRKKALLDFYMNRDKEIVEDILKNIKKL